MIKKPKRKPLTVKNPIAKQLQGYRTTPKPPTVKQLKETVRNLHSYCDEMAARVKELQAIATRRMTYIEQLEGKLRMINSVARLQGDASHDERLHPN